MTKMKAILPSLREKKRYLAFEIISKKKIEKFSKVSEAFWQSSLSFIGEKEMARANIWLLPDMWNEAKQRGIIKINNKYLHEIKAALTLIKKINRQNIIVRSLGVSGILKKAKIYIGG